MAHIFTIQFSYLNADQYALVNVSSQGKESSFHIQFHDCALDPIILSNHLRYSGLDGYKYIDVYKNEDAKHLLDCIGQEVAKHVTTALTDKKDM
jgi:hypothetical protein